MIIEQLLAQLGVVGIFVIIAVIVLSLSFHESMHAFMAHWLGDTTASDQGRLSLNPLKHIDPFTTIGLPLMLLLVGLPPFLIAKPVPFNPLRVKWGEFGAALVGVAGPLSNLLLALVAAGLIQLLGVGNSTLLFMILGVFLEINIAVFVFNMIPFPPLDGSRVLYAIAPAPVQKFMEQIEATGLIGIFIFMVVIFPVLVPVVVMIQEFFLITLLG